MCDGTGVGVDIESPPGPIPPTYTPTLFTPASFQSRQGCGGGEARRARPLHRGQGNLGGRQLGPVLPSTPPRLSWPGAGRSPIPAMREAGAR